MTEIQTLRGNGITLRTPRTVHDDIRDQLVREIAGDHLERKQRGDWPEGKRDRLEALHDAVDPATFNEVLMWLSSAKRAALPTKRGYVEDLTEIAKWAAEHFGLSPVPLLQVMDADAIVVWNVYTRSRSSKRSKGSKGMAVRTHRRMLSALSSLFTYASKHGWPVSNPVDFEEHARPIGTSDNGRPAGATRVLTMDEVARMREACETAEERLCIELMAALGMRESEIVQVWVENIDRGHSPAVLKFARKRGKWKEQELALTIQAHLDTFLAGRAEGPLLTSEDGQPRDRFHLINMTRRIARRAGIPSPRMVTPHTLRAFAITAALDDGIPVHEVQKWAGHASPETTQAYWERRNGARRDAAITGRLLALLDSAAADLKEDE